MSKTALILNSADREAMRARWNQHFENRSITDRKPENRLEIRNSAGDVAEVLLYDEIGFWGIQAADFVSQLAQITAPAISVRINSPGGSAFDALAMFAALQSHPADVTCTVEGWAASAASIIALAGSKMIMAPNSMLMIHKALTVAIGNSDEMIDTANTLIKLDGQLAAIYAKKSGKDPSEMLGLMKGAVDGTWFNADEAKAIGLCDEISGEDPDEADPAATAAAKARMNAMRRRLAMAEVDL